MPKIDEKILNKDCEFWIDNSISSPCQQVLLIDSLTAAGIFFRMLRKECYYEAQLRIWALLSKDHKGMGWDITYMRPKYKFLQLFDFLGSPPQFMPNARVSKYIERILTLINIKYSINIKTKQFKSEQRLNTHLSKDRQMGQKIT